MSPRSRRSMFSNIPPTSWLSQGSKAGNFAALRLDPSLPFSLSFKLDCLPVGGGNVETMSGAGGDIPTALQLRSSGLGGVLLLLELLATSLLCSPSLLAGIDTSREGSLGDVLDSQGPL